MRNLTDFVKTSISGGFFVVLPVLLVFLVLNEVFDLIDALAAPIASLVVLDAIDESTERTLIGIMILIVTCFLTGFAMRTRIGARFGKWLEDLTLMRIPGYSLIRTLSRRLSGEDSDSKFVPALVSNVVGASVLAFIVEEHDNGDYTIYFPAAPTPAVGQVLIVSREQVRKLNVPMTAAANCFWEFGIGCKDLLASSAAGAPDRGTPTAKPG